jgi:hypothetical protein
VLFYVFARIDAMASPLAVKLDDASIAQRAKPGFRYIEERCGILVRDERPIAEYLIQPELHALRDCRQPPADSIGAHFLYRR